MPEITSPEALYQHYKSLPLDSEEMQLAKQHIIKDLHRSDPGNKDWQ